MECECLWTATSSTLKNCDTGLFLEQYWAEWMKCHKTEKTPDCQVCCKDREKRGPKERDGQLLMEEWLKDPDEGFTVKLTESQISSDSKPPLPSDSGSDSDSTHSSH
jgi:hypothetical protein